MVFNFFARRPDTTKRPACPKCRRPKLQRRLSRFAISKGRAEPDEDGLPPGMDEGAMEAAMSELMNEAERINEDDPRQMARMMRKLFEKTGMQPGDSMEEALRRLEAGEDPDKLDEEMGDLLDDDDSLFGESGGGGSLGKVARRLRPPAVDETLYDL
jgi:hypothetical protein